MAVVVIVSGVGLVPASAARGHYVVKQLGRAGLPDPSPLRTGHRVHLVGTGGRFPALTARTPASRFRSVGPALVGLPRWYGVGLSGSRHLWAPHVVQVHGRRIHGRRHTSYLMYFAATHRGGWDCIAVARSRRPTSGFRSTGGPLLCGGRRATMIDPALFIGPRGNRFLTYVRRDRVTGVGQIKIIALGPRGLHVRPHAHPQVLVSNGRTITEAPSMFRSHGATWLFVSRYSYKGCRYRTEVYRARTPLARYRPVGPDHGRLVLRGRGGRLLCGAGGGEVLRVGNRLRFYFHAWKGGTEATGGRRAPFMAVLRWRHGRPVVAKHR